MIIPALPLAAFWLAAPLVLGLALCVQPHFLVMLDFALTMLPGQWEVSGVMVDFTDLVLAGVFLRLVLDERWRRRRPIHSIPHLKLWLVLGLLNSIAYLTADTNQDQLTSLPAITYQLYRYAWRPILYYPVSFLLLRDRKVLATLLLAVVVCTDVGALQAMWQAYAGLEPGGPFGTHNGLGGALIMPFVLALTGSLYSADWRHRLIYGGSTLLMLRVLTLAGSRGALMAIAGAVAVLVFLLTRTVQGRRRTLRIAKWAAAVAILAVVLKPNMMERPNIQRILSIAQGTSTEALQWRIQERWPHFARKVVDHPWLGLGTVVDPTLGNEMNTPHNGFLALALMSGVPAAAILLAFAVMGIRRGLRSVRRATEPRDRAVGMAVAAGVVGLLIHNIVDVTILLPFPSKIFWLFIAMSETNAESSVVAARPVPSRRAVVHSQPLRPAIARKGSA